MNARSIKKLAAYQILCALLLTGQARSQEILYQPDPDSPIGERNAAAPDGTEQYDFLIGDWNIDITLFGGEQNPLNYRAKWHNHWVADGYVVMQEWRGPYSTGIELRGYDPGDDIWQGRNVYYPSPGTWYSNTAKKVNDEIVVTTSRTDTEGLETITREIYWEIQSESFRIRTEQSTDGGATWQPGKYELVASRALHAAN
jgi:hypothetical protein